MTQEEIEVLLNDVEDIEKVIVTLKEQIRLGDERELSLLDLYDNITYILEKMESRGRRVVVR